MTKKRLFRQNVILHCSYNQLFLKKYFTSLKLLDHIVLKETARDKPEPSC